MNENWLTSTVFALCNGMRSRDDYSEMPLLADALEEAGCRDEDLLGRVRSEASHVLRQRLVCVVLGGELAEAVCMVQWFADEFGMGMTYEELIRMGQEGDRWYGSWDTPDVAYDKYDELVTSLRRILGQEADGPASNIGFSCAC